MASYGRAVTGTAVMARSANEEKKKSKGLGGRACFPFGCDNFCAVSACIEPS